MKTPTTIYCEHCGALIEADSKFCAECGNKVHETSANQSQIRSELPRKQGPSSTSTALAVAGICILAVLAVLYSSGVFDSTPTSTGRLPPKLPPFSSFSEKQVLQKARAEIESKLIHCGDSWYGWLSSWLQEKSPIEMKGIDVRIKPEELTQADKANRIEWKGFVTFGAELYREHDGRNWNRWLDGREGVPIGGNGVFGRGVFRLEVKNGQYHWDARITDARRPNFACGNIPK